MLPIKFDCNWPSGLRDINTRMSGGTDGRTHGRRLVFHPIISTCELQSQPVEMKIHCNYDSVIDFNWFCQTQVSSLMVIHQVALMPSQTFWSHQRPWSHISYNNLERHVKLTNMKYKDSTSPRNKMI